MKGISEIVTIILLLIIVIVVVGMSFTFFSNIVESAGQTTESQIEQQGQNLGENFNVESANGNVVYIRNTGYTEINTSSLAFFVDGHKIDMEGSSQIINPGGVTVVALNSAQLDALGSTSRIKVSGVSYSQTLEYNYTPAGYGNISITSNIIGAEISIDNVSTNLFTNAVIHNVTAGLHTIKLNMTGYYDNQATANVAANNVTAVYIALQLIPSPGFLDVDSTPRGASIYLNGTLEGHTPVVLTKTAGYYELNITMAGYYDNVTTILINDSTTTFVNVTLASVPQFCGDGACNGHENELTCIDCPAHNLNVYLDDDWETYDSYICSPKLWTINNMKINLSLSYGTFNDVDPDCIHESGTGYDKLDGTPMRLRDFVSNSSYRINQIFPNETKFCAQLIGSGPSLYCSFYTAYINSSAPENYNILPNGIKFNFDTTNDAPGLIGNISYRMTNDSNYVRVDAAWKNTGGSAIVIRPAFQWSQKHPPHGYYRSDDGDYADTMITNPPTNIFSRKWISFWSSVSSDDLIGWIINNETDAIRYANFNTYFHILIYKQISTNLNPGDTYTMTFYIMSDQRGSSGQEWLPVNQTYCNIFWNTTYCGATK